MLAEVLEYLQTQKSLELARKNGLGPFAKKYRGALSLKPAFAERTGAGVIPLTCSIGHVSDRDINNLIFKGEHPVMEWTQANLHFRLQIPVRVGREESFHYTLEDEIDTAWLAKPVAMNRRAAHHATDMAHTILDDEILLTAISDSTAKSESALDPQLWVPHISTKQIRVRCHALLNELKDHMPDDARLVIPPRNPEPGIMQGWSRDFSREDAFADAPLEVLHYPYFPAFQHRNIDGHFGAFRFYRDGVLNWVQFANIDHTDAADFIIINPANSNGYRTRKMMSGENALTALDTIQRELDDDQRTMFGDIMTRLHSRAHEIVAEDAELERQYELLNQSRVMMQMAIDLLR
jgi:hypothetical protein